jgi:phage terminase small subunit
MRKRRHRTDPPPLCAREVRFCQLYVEHGNATRAYAEAGFPHKDGRSAAVLAFKRLRKVKVREFVRGLQHAAADVAQATVEELAQGFRRVATADVTVIFAREGEVFPPSGWPKDFVSAVTSIEVEEVFETRSVRGKRRKVRAGTRWKVKLENKTEARKVLAQWLGMVGKDKGERGNSSAAGVGEPHVQVYLPDNGRGDGPGVD